MERNIVAVYDRKMDAFGQPIFVPALGVAIRSFQDEANNTTSEIHKHPEDYTLYHLGTYDDSTGQFRNLEKPHQLALADQLVTK